jgi:CRP-like cAMP-binding protein
LLHSADRSEKERISIARQFEVHQYTDGETIISQGSHGEHFFIIKRGVIQFTRQERLDETPKDIGVLFAGQIFGTKQVRIRNYYSPSVPLSQLNTLSAIKLNSF